MRWLVMADVHANASALKAVLNTSQAKSCDRILSLGDQVNYGPDPFEVMDTLKRLDAVMLLGNHEERFLHISDYGTYNWGILRWTYDQMRGVGMNLLPEYRIGCVLCVHGMPGDPYKLVDEETVKPYLEALDENTEYLLSGHNHYSWNVMHNGKTAFNPGSLGMKEKSIGGTAPFAVMEIHGDEVTIEACSVPYDLKAVGKSYANSELPKVAPELSRIAYHIMKTGCHQELLKWVLFARKVSAEMNSDPNDPKVWAEADRRWDWDEKIESRAYWEALR